MVLNRNSLTNDSIQKFFYDNNSQNALASFTYISNCVDDTNYLAQILCSNLNKKDIVVLNGELGSGKTAFMYGVAKFFNIENQISSPTFTIVNEYSTKDNFEIYHFDVYRLESSDEFLDQIGTEYFDNGLCFIEWGEIISDIIPNHAIIIDISKDDKDLNKRYFKIWRKN